MELGDRISENCFRRNLFGCFHRHLIGLFHFSQAVHQDDAIHLGDLLHLGVADDLFDGGSTIDVVDAEREGTNPERGVVWVVAVVVESAVVGAEGEGEFVVFPQGVDGLGHIGGGGVVHVGQVSVFPGVGDTGVGDEVLVADGVGDAVEQFLCVFDQPLDPLGVSGVVSVGKVVGVGEVFHVVVAVEQHHLLAVFFFVFDDFEEVVFECLEGVGLIGVEEIADEDVDALEVNEAFPGVSAVDVADDVEGSAHNGKGINKGVYCWRWPPVLEKRGSSIRLQLN